MYGRHRPVWHGNKGPRKPQTLKRNGIRAAPSRKCKSRVQVKINADPSQVPGLGSSFERAQLVIGRLSAWTHPARKCLRGFEKLPGST